MSYFGYTPLFGSSFYITSHALWQEGENKNNIGLENALTSGTLGFGMECTSRWFWHWAPRWGWTAMHSTPSLRWVACTLLFCLWEKHILVSVFSMFTASWSYGNVFLISGLSDVNICPCRQVNNCISHFYSTQASSLKHSAHSLPPVSRLNALFLNRRQCSVLWTVQWHSKNLSFRPA